MGIRVISSREVEKYIGKSNVVFIDIRDKAAYKEFHIEGALCLSEKELGLFLKRKGKSPLYIVCCQRGVSSLHVCKKFDQLGYRMGTVAGGIDAYMKSH